MYRNSKDNDGYCGNSSLLRWDVALPGWLVRMSVSNKFSCEVWSCAEGSESKRSCASFGFQY